MIARHAHRFEDSEVLEIGCGPLSGITEEFCRQRRVRYTGLDTARLPHFHIPWLPGHDMQRRMFGPLVRFGVHA